MAVSGIRIDYYPAGADCLIIFTGLGGDTKGYANKYVKIAEEVSGKYGCSVYVAGVPLDCWSRPQEVFTSVLDYVMSANPHERVYVMGSSAGACLCIWYAHMYPQIKKVLAVNPVLNLNYHRTKDGIVHFAGEKMSVVTGELDPCAMWVNLLPKKANVTAEILRGADHVFTDMLDKFISLPINILFA